MTREEWLVQISKDWVLPKLAALGFNTGYQFRVSIGFPYGSRGTNKAIGQCWGTSASKDGVHEIFISPVLSAEDVVHVLLHEHIHASVGLEAGHKGPFRKCAKAVGLEGKMTATVPGPALKAEIAGLLANFEPYPHGKMNVGAGGAGGKQSTRMIKCTCEECGYTVRVSRKWIDIGYPVCPEHSSMQPEGL